MTAVRVTRCGLFGDWAAVCRAHDWQQQAGSWGAAMEAACGHIGWVHRRPVVECTHELTAYVVSRPTDVWCVDCGADMGGAA